MHEDLAGLDPALYTRLPVLDVPAGVSLGIALLAASERSLPKAVREAAATMRERVVQLQARWAEQRDAEQQPRENPRPADIRLDRAWAAVGRRLESLLPLPIAQAEPASALHSALFPTGLSFLTLPFEKQWAESQQRLDQIERQGLTAELHRLVGQFVLDEVQQAHEAYGEVLGITVAKQAEAVPTRVAEALRELRDAMAIYGLQLVAAAHAKPDIMALVRKALRPIDDLRAAQQQRAPAPGRSEAQPQVSPSTPVPELG